MVIVLYKIVLHWRLRDHQLMLRFVLRMRICLAHSYASSKCMALVNMIRMQLAFEDEDDGGEGDAKNMGPSPSRS